MLSSLESSEFLQSATLAESSSALYDLTLELWVKCGKQGPLWLQAYVLLVKEIHCLPVTL